MLTCEGHAECTCIGSSTRVPTRTPHAHKAHPSQLQMPGKKPRRVPENHSAVLCASFRAATAWQVSRRRPYRGTARPTAHGGAGCASGHWAFTRSQARSISIALHCRRRAGAGAVTVHFAFLREARRPYGAQPTTLVRWAHGQDSSSVGTLKYFDGMVTVWRVGELVTAARAFLSVWPLWVWVGGVRQICVSRVTLGLGAGPAGPAGSRGWTRCGLERPLSWSSRSTDDRRSHAAQGG